MKRSEERRRRAAEGFVNIIEVSEKGIKKEGDWMQARGDSNIVLRPSSS